VKSSRERELKLSAAADFRLPSLGGLGSGVVAAVPGEQKQLLATYFDTEDLRLARFGVTLRHRTDDGWTVKLPEGEGGDFLVRNELVFPGDVLQPPADAIDLVRAYTRSRPVEPRARLSTLRSVVELADAEGTKLGELADDTVSVLDERRHTASSFRELEIEVTEAAPPKVAKRIVKLLQDAGAGPTEQIPKIVRALGQPAQAPPDVAVHELTSDATAGDVVRRAIASSVTRLIHHDPVVRLDADPEGVHKARVATRTLRSDLRTFAPLVDRDWSDGLRGELGWLAALLGRVRDADVMLARLGGRVERLPGTIAKAADPILATLGVERAQALAELLEALRGERYVDLLDALVAAARTPELSAGAVEPAKDVLAGLVGHPWRSLEGAVTALGRRPSDAELHDVRIKAKRCRYAAEAAASVLGKQAAGFADAAADLQDALGDLNDAVVAEAWLRDWATGRRASAAVFAAGELAGRERSAAEASRAGWRKAWKALAAARPRSLA
jgi:CHAD domain-containing protein